MYIDVELIKTVAIILTTIFSLLTLIVTISKNPNSMKNIWKWVKDNNVIDIGVNIVTKYLENKKSTNAGEKDSETIIKEILTDDTIEE